MGVGHLAASFALRSRVPQVPLFFLLAAGVLVDFLWGLTILFGLEHARISAERGSIIPLVLESVPYTHSLIACVVWAGLASGAWWLWKRDRTGALVLGVLVLSHWLLDFASHVDDVPLLPGGPLLGLGLWRSLTGSLVVELGMLGAGLALYARGTVARDRIGSIGLLICTGVLLFMGAGAFLGPPPTSVLPIAVGNVALVLVLWIIQWLDGHRKLRGEFERRA